MNHRDLQMVDDTSKMMYYYIVIDMEIVDYSTSGGKNLILEYINNLEESERLEILDIREAIEKKGIAVFEKLRTRQLQGKLWEIKASQNRIMYVIVNKDLVAFLHICKKQKRKAEKQEINKAMKRAIMEGLM